MRWRSGESCEFEHAPTTCDASTTTPPLNNPASTIPLVILLARVWHCSLPILHSVRVHIAASGLRHRLIAIKTIRAPESEGARTSAGPPPGILWNRPIGVQARRRRWPRRWWAAAPARLAPPLGHMVLLFSARIAEQKDTNSGGEGRLISRAICGLAPAWNNLSRSNLERGLRSVGYQAISGWGVAAPKLQLRAAALGRASWGCPSCTHGGRRTPGSRVATLHSPQRSRCQC